MKYKVKITHDPTATASYVSQILCEVKTVWGAPITQQEAETALGAINNLIDEMLFTMSRNTRIKGKDVIRKKYCHLERRIDVYNLSGRRRILSFSIEPHYFSFKDLKFKPRDIKHPDFREQAILFFDNNHGVSVLFGDCYYSNGKDTYEVGIIEKTEDGFVLVNRNENPLGYRTAEEVTALMKEIQNDEICVDKGV